MTCPFLEWRGLFGVRHGLSVLGAGRTGSAPQGHHQFGAAVDSELLEYAAELDLDAAFGALQSGRDLFVAQSGADQIGQGSLGGGQLPAAAVVLGIRGNTRRSSRSFGCSLSQAQTDGGLRC